jgi:hypothetical protein
VVVVVLDPHPAVIAATATSTAGIALIFTKGPFSRSVSERSMQRYYAYLGPCGISLLRSRSARPSRPATSTPNSCPRSLCWRLDWALARDRDSYDIGVSARLNGLVW